MLKKKKRKTKIKNKYLVYHIKIVIFMYYDIIRRKAFIPYIRTVILSKFRSPLRLEYFLIFYFSTVMA